MLQLTIGIEDVVNLLQGETLRSSRATAQLNNVRHGLERDKAGRGWCRVLVLGDSELTPLLVLELDFEDAVGLATGVSTVTYHAEVLGCYELTPGGKMVSVLMLPPPSSMTCPN